MGADHSACTTGSPSRSRTQSPLAKRCGSTAATAVRRSATAHTEPQQSTTPMRRPSSVCASDSAASWIASRIELALLQMPCAAAPAVGNLCVSAAMDVNPLAEALLRASCTISSTPTALASSFEATATPRRMRPPSALNNASRVAMSQSLVEPKISATGKVGQILTTALSKAQIVVAVRATSRTRTRSSSASGSLTRACALASSAERSCGRSTSKRPGRALW
eukprot:5579631-Prymnesium_polylepis.3